MIDNDAKRYQLALAKAFKLATLRRDKESLARLMVREAIRARGEKLSWYSCKDITLAASHIVAEGA